MKQRKERNKAKARDELVREGQSEKESGEFSTLLSHVTGPLNLK